MKRNLAIAGLSLGILAAGAVPALAGTASGNGAQKANLSAQAGSTTSQCVEGTSGGNGWIMLNKTGSPANTAATLYQGEVHLIGGAPTTTYMVELASTSNNQCMPVGSLTTNGQGIGNGHIPVPTASTQSIASGSYYIVLLQGTSEAFASGPVTVS